MSTLITRKVNDYKIRPIKKYGGKENSKPVKGGDLFDLYCNIYICARKKSGKTVLIYHLIKLTCTKNTTIVFFVSTFYRDDGYKDIAELCDDMGIPYIVHTSIMDDEIKGLNILETMVKGLKENVLAEDEKDDTKTTNQIMFGDDNSNEPKVRKSTSKWQVPEYVFIFDDISHDIKRSETLASFLKDSRHIKSKVIISSQSFVDVPKNARTQFDYFILFRGMPEEKLMDLYDESAISTIPFEEFDKIYHEATKVITHSNGKKERHNFLYVDRNNEKFRKNLNEEIETSYELSEGI